MREGSLEHRSSLLGILPGCGGWRVVAHVLALSFTYGEAGHTAGETVIINLIFHAPCVLSFCLRTRVLQRSLLPYVYTPRIITVIFALRDTKHTIEFHLILRHPASSLAPRKPPSLLGLPPTLLLLGRRAGHCLPHLLCKITESGSLRRLGLCLEAGKQRMRRRCFCPIRVQA